MFLHDNFVVRSYGTTLQDMALVTHISTKHPHAGNKGRLRCSNPRIPQKRLDQHNNIQARIGHARSHITQNQTVKSPGERRETVINCENIQLHTTGSCALIIVACLDCCRCAEKIWDTYCRNIGFTMPGLTYAIKRS